MKLATTTDDFCEYITDSRALSYTLDCFRETPFRHFDLSFCAVTYPGSVWYESGDGWKREAEDCAKKADAYGYDFVQAHAPFMPYQDYFDPDKRPAYMRAIHHSIEACAMLGIPHITIHGIYQHMDAQDKFIRENLRFCRELGETAEKYGVDILIENFQDGNYGYYFRRGLEMRQFIEYADIPRLHACWDTGHANIGKGFDQYHDLLELGSHLRALHIQDNWGTSDAHVMPMVGIVNFDQIIKALIEIGYKGFFSFEAPDTLRVGGDSHHRRRDLLPDDKLANPTIFLQQKMTTVKYEIGKWMLETYGVFEE